MDIQLTPVEARVLGVLIEKELTTPEYYPLSLNAVVDACNQKSNRDPVMNLQERQVSDALKNLVVIHLVWEKNSLGSRVTKYAHRIANTLTKAYDFSPSERAIICVLLLRGPQTPGELRTRAGRMGNFTNVDEVEAGLQRLLKKDGGPYVIELGRQAGQREARYMHLFTAPEQNPAAGDQLPGAGDENDRLNELVQEVALLRAEVRQLKEQLENFIKHD